MADTNVSAEGRHAIVSTSISGTTFRFRKMKAVEGLSRLFEIDLVCTADNNEITFDDIGGQMVTVTIGTSDGNSRHYSGLVAELKLNVGMGTGGNRELVTEYHMKLVPFCWPLTQRGDCRIFNSIDGQVENSVTDIIDTVFGDAGCSEKLELGTLSETYPSHDYIVQFNESDFDFASRLMEREGIYYFFEHSDGDHVMILADSDTAHIAAEGYAQIPFVDDFEGSGAEAIKDWAWHKAIRTEKYHQRDYDPTDPKKDLKADAPDEGSDLPWYEYPGRYVVKADGDRYSTVRLQQRRFGHEIVRGVSNALGVIPGYRFELISSPHESQNREYLVTDSVTVAEANPEGRSTEGEIEIEKFEVKFEGIVATDRYRPPRRTPVPRATGPHTAEVVGQDNEEITTDEFGRIKVKFHWDRAEATNQDCSCWIRVAQSWAHGGWGSQFIPRHGMEVIVEYINADLDRPIVTGCVYNGNNKPPFELPANATQTGHKSRSSKEGAADNFNEIRFEDKKDEELLYIHAEKDAERVVENNDVQKIGMEKKDPGDQTIEIQNHRTITVLEGNETFDVKQGNRTVTVDEGNEKLEVKAGDQDIIVGSGKQTTDVATTIVIKAGDEITLETGAAKLNMKSDGTIELSGKDITLKGTGNIKAEATANFEAKGLAATVKGGASGTFDGGGSCTVKGAIVNIN